MPQLPPTAPAPDPPAVTRRKVFISYAREDRDWALQKYETLTQAGHEVFLDTESIRAGEGWPDRLRRALLDADMVMLGWSDATHRSAWVRSEYTAALEIRAAWNDPGFLIIQRLDDSPLPAALADIQAAEARRIRPRPISLWMRAGAVLCALPLLFVLIHPRAASLGMLALCFGLCLVGVSVPLLLQLAAKRRDAIAAGCRNLGAWLMNPDRLTALRHGRRALRWLYGDRFLSRRTFGRAILLSIAAVAATLGLSVVVFGWDAGLRIFRRPLAGGVPYAGWILGLNVICDLISLGSTWFLLRLALRNPRWGILIGLLVVDVALALVLASAPTLLGPMLSDYLTHGQWASQQELATTILGSDVLSLPMPSVFNRADFAVPNAVSEWFLWHEVPGHWHLYGLLLLPNTISGIMVAVCLATACLPSLLLGGALLAATLRGPSRWLTRAPARLLIWVGETRRPIVSGAYAIAWPLALVAMSLAVAFDDPAPGPAFAPRLAGLGQRTLIETCRTGAGLDAIDHCIVAARRLRDRRAHGAAVRVLLVGRGRLLDRIAPQAPDACGHRDCWSIDPATVERLIQQYAVGDAALPIEAFPQMALKPARDIPPGRLPTLRLGAHEIPWGSQSLDPFARAEALDVLSALWRGGRIEVSADDGIGVQRRLFRLDGSEPAGTWTDIRPGAAAPIEIRSAAPLRVHWDPLASSPRPTQVRFAGPADGIWHIELGAAEDMRHIARDSTSGVYYRLHWVGIAPPGTPAEALLQIPSGQSLTYRQRAVAWNGALSLTRSAPSMTTIGLTAMADPGRQPVIARQLIDGLTGLELEVPDGASLLLAPPIRHLSELVSAAPIEPSDTGFGVAWGDGRTVHRVEGGWRARWPAFIGPRAFTFAESPGAVRLSRRKDLWARAVAPASLPAHAHVRSGAYAYAYVDPQYLDLQEDGWVAVGARGGVVARLRVDAPLMQSSHPLVGLITERTAAGEHLSTSHLLRHPGTSGAASTDPLVRLAPAIPEHRPLRLIFVRSFAPARGAPAGLGPPLGIAPLDPRRRLDHLFDLLIKPGDHIVEVNGHRVGDDPLWLDAASDPAVLRTVDDHITLVVERPDPVERPAYMLPHRVVIEYTPHPLDPSAGPAWLDEVIGPRPSDGP